eukprot:TRINITY_DN5252_c0_g1_i6.p1 TRINITY_DN5252_c0_g1~~TRINITY_DN5252_c0_g1_i6.p1  ORF type:complete len:176 (-),score=65.76 TRINITY_DN5252_c0_g1_i6:1259-1786(-)
MIDLNCNKHSTQPLQLKMFARLGLKSSLSGSSSGSTLGIISRDYAGQRVRGGAGFNKVMLMGNAAKEPETQIFDNGNQVTKFSLATNESWKNKDGEYVTKTEWHNVCIWNDHLQEVASSFIKKGSMVYVEGKITSYTYSGSDGSERKGVQIDVPKYNGVLQVITHDEEEEFVGPT